MNSIEREQILERFRAHAARFERVARSKRPDGPDTAIAKPPAKAAGKPSLRELEVLQLVADGLTNDEIAARLIVSLETVKTHVRNTLAKLKANSRAHAVGIGLRAGLLR
jgi:DNA-binding NarL/FixJ family response regulator